MTTRKWQEVRMNKKRLVVVIIILIAATAVLTYLATQNSGESNNGKIGVVVSVAPEMEFVKAVGGDRVNVSLMVPPGADPHTYEPLPNQLREVSRAKMYVEVGTPLEFELNYMDRIKSSNQDMLVVNGSQGIELIQNTAEHENNSDPHVWVSPKKARIMVENIYQGLVQVDPAGQEYYAENRDQYIRQLNDLDKNITESLRGKENTKILVYHPAWAYFCNDYRLQQIAIESGGKEPTSQEIAKVVDLARENNIKVIFVEPQYSPQAAQVIASEIGGRVVVIDDLSENYLENMRKVQEAFSKI